MIWRVLSSCYLLINWTLLPAPISHSNPIPLHPSFRPCRGPWGFLVCLFFLYQKEAWVKYVEDSGLMVFTLFREQLLWESVLLTIGRKTLLSFTYSFHRYFKASVIDVAVLRAGAKVPWRKRMYSRGQESDMGWSWAARRQCQEERGPWGGGAERSPHTGVSSTTGTCLLWFRRSELLVSWVKVPWWAAKSLQVSWDGGTLRPEARTWATVMK